MVILVFVGGLVTGMVIGWFCLALLSYGIIKRRKRHLAELRSRES